MTDTYTYPEGITPELLMAYADGALEAAEVDRVEAALETHPELAEEVRAYRQTAAALAGAFDAPLGEAVPAHLEALVMGTAAKQDNNVIALHAGRTRRYGGLPVWGEAIAACVFFGVGALLGGQFPTGDGADSVDRRLLIAGQLEIAHPLAQALESAASAQTIDIAGGKFDAVASYPVASGVTCREFEALDARGAAVGLACRRDGAWTVEVLLHAEPALTPADGFQLASGLDSDVIGSVLDRLGAGVGLAADVETCLIENDWEGLACLEQ